MTIYETKFRIEYKYNSKQVTVTGFYLEGILESSTIPKSLTGLKRMINRDIKKNNPNGDLITGMILSWNFTRIYD